MKKILSYFNLTSEIELPSSVIEKIDKGATFKGTNLWIFVFAIFIASLGLNVNSASVIIGAMLVSPLMGPIMGIGLSIAINDVKLLRKSIITHSLATLVGLTTSTLYFVISPVNVAHSEILARTSPNVYDVLIALFGGFAGIIATSSQQKGNVIPGVAIATALMPPLCTAGFGIATLNVNFIFGALYLFFINTVFIAIATLITVRFLKFPIRHPEEKKNRIKSRFIIISVVVLAIGPSIYFAYDMVRQNNFMANANKFIEKESVITDDYLLNKKVDASKRTITLTYGGKEISEEQIKALNDKLPEYDLDKTTVIVQQGFSTINEQEKNVELSSINQTLLKKDQQIQALTKQLDSLQFNPKQTVQILKELKTQYSGIESLVIQPTYEYGDTTSEKQLLVVIKSGRSIEKSNQKKILEWMKVRLNTPNCRTIFEI